MRRLAAVIILCLISLPAKGQDNSSPAPDYFADAVVDNPTPYVGQQITYHFRFYDAVGVTNPLYEAPDFEGFWRIDKRSIAQTNLQLNNRQYGVTEVDTALYPTRPGAMTIAPSKVLLPETVFRSQEEASAPSVTINVKS